MHEVMYQSDVQVIGGDPGTGLGLKASQGCTCALAFHSLERENSPERQRDFRNQ
jgi:hypothetical protein